MAELKTIKLLGAAGRKFGRVHKLAVASPAEAVRALTAIFQGFKPWVLSQHERGIQWKVITDSAEGLDAEETLRETSKDTIVLAPVLVGRGGKGGGIGKIIAGVALIAVAIFIPAATFGLASMLGVGLVGAGLALSGVADLITPTPRLSGPKAGAARKGQPSARVSRTEAARGDDLESNLFSRAQGTGGQGEAVPVVYGLRRVQAPRVVNFQLGLLGDREIETTGTVGLLGYVNNVEL